MKTGKKDVKPHFFISHWLRFRQLIENSAGDSHSPFSASPTILTIKVTDDQSMCLSVCQTGGVVHSLLVWDFEIMTLDSRLHVRLTQIPRQGTETCRNLGFWIPLISSLLRFCSQKKKLLFVYRICLTAPLSICLSFRLSSDWLVR